MYYRPVESYAPFLAIYQYLKGETKALFYDLKKPFCTIKTEGYAALVSSHIFFWQKIFTRVFYAPLRKKPSRKIRRIRALLKTRIRRKSAFNLVLSRVKNSFIVYFYYNNLTNTLSSAVRSFVVTSCDFKLSSIDLVNFYKQITGEGFIYLRGLFIAFFVDACLTDDEPLWEPVEWSLAQSWLLFIFIFAWIAENLITSRYGSYTGRDKRVWLAWYKTFWLVELVYILSYGLTALFVIVPFYYELTYSLSFVFSWWNWYTKVFFFKFIAAYSVTLAIAHLLQLNARWLGWKKLLFFAGFVCLFLAYLLYSHFIMAFFAYFTDPLWYQKTRYIDYIQLSHEPLKWGWGPASRDHFTYHKVSTVFWFKNDGPFAGAFLMLHLFLFLSLFFLNVYWVVFFRRVYATKEVTYTFLVYCVSALKQFFFLFLLLFILVFVSFIVCYWRFPIEFIWVANSDSWFVHFLGVLRDYAPFVLSIFF